MYFLFLSILVQFWDECTVQDCLALERLQNEAARIVTGLTRSVSLENLYRECGWRPLSERRMKNKLVFMYNVVNERVPSYISDLIPPLVRETTQYPLRNNNNIMFPFARTEISRRFCIPSSISLWNSLEHDFREAQNVNAFKYQLKKLKFSPSQVPLYYFDGERYLSVMHVRMRNNCSNLKHLYSNRLVQSPFCNCANVGDDAEHFFFKCTNFTRERIALFHATRNFHPLNLNKVLFGDEHLSFQDNKILFKGIQTYIKSH